MWYCMSQPPAVSFRALISTSPINSSSLFFFLSPPPPPPPPSVLSPCFVLTALGAERST